MSAGHDGRTDVSGQAWQAELEWLFARQRFGVHPGLGRVQALLARLGDPQASFRTVLVGGTNGKGSTAATLAATLRAGGVRAGLFTSPHLTHFSERFVVDGQELPEEVVAAALARVRPEAEAVGASFFEIVTALGALLFAESGVQVAVMEVGLGGRLDATNALAPVLSVVTNVGLDHTEFLGSTPQAIAAEKAGILRDGCPAVVGVGGDVEAIFAATGADLWRLDDHLLGIRLLGWEGAQVTLRGPEGPVTLHTPLLGAHGARNAALAALAALRLDLPVQAVARGVAAAQWPGRLEVLPWRGGRVLLDGAHNPDGAQALAAALRDLGVGPLPLVFGAAGDKDIGAVASALRDSVSEVILTRAVLSPRAAEPASLAGLFAGVPVKVTDSPAAALAALADRAAPLALVCGSLYLLGEVRPLLLGEAAGHRERWQ